jgi:hypothetical protein
MAAAGHKVKTPKKRLSKEQKAAIVISSESHQVITGMLLSDCCIAFSNDSKDARLQIEQKDRDFVEHTLLSIWIFSFSKADLARII